MPLNNGTNSLLTIQGDKLLATLLIQLEEIEEQIDGLHRSRLELLQKISSQSRPTHRLDWQIPIPTTKTW